MHCVAFFLSLAAAPASAFAPAAAPSAPASDAERLAAAMDLYEPQQLKQLALEGGLRAADAAMKVERQAREARGGPIPEALFQKLRKFVFEDTQRLFDEMAPTIHAETAAIYAKHFTAAELRELKRLMTNPVMKKMERLTPIIMTDLATIGMAQAAKGEPERKRKIEQMVKEWMEEEATLRAIKPGT